MLGHGAHPDPASELAPVIADGVADRRAVVVSLCAAEDDPQIVIDRPVSSAEQEHRFGHPTPRPHAMRSPSSKEASDG